MAWCWVGRPLKQVGLAETLFPYMIADIAGGSGPDTPRVLQVLAGCLENNLLHTGTSS